MLPVGNTLNPLAVAPTGANLLAVIQTISALPLASKNKYANALTALYNSFPAISVTTPPFTCHTAPAPPDGVGIPRSAAVLSHQTDAVLALQLLDALAPGQALLQAICQNSLPPPVGRGRRVRIQDSPAYGGNACRRAAAGGGHPGDAKTQLTAALESNHGAVGGCIANAMTQLGHPVATAGSYAWLEAQISATPIYNIVGTPAAVASQTVHGANWISAAMIQNWAAGVPAFPLPLAGQQALDAEVGLGAALYCNARRIWAQAVIRPHCGAPPAFGLLVRSGSFRIAPPTSLSGTS
jgi:hypothetical protein